MSRDNLTKILLQTESHWAYCMLHWRKMGIGVRDEFRWGGWSLLSEYFFLHCLHENQVVLPECYLIVLPQNGYLKILGALQPPKPHGPYAYENGGQISQKICIFLLIHDHPQISRFVLLHEFVKPPHYVELRCQLVNANCTIKQIKSEQSVMFLVLKCEK